MSLINDRISGASTSAPARSRNLSTPSREPRSPNNVVLPLLSREHDVFTKEATDMNTYTLAGRGNRLLSRLRLNGQRRLNSTKPEDKAKDVTPPTTIPGPGMGWIEPLKEPFRAYGRMQNRSPYITQLSTTLIIYFLGDLSAQKVSSTEPYEPSRGLRALVIGGISSIPNYKWFMFLGNHFNYKSHVASIATKIVINQTFFTPCFNTYFFGMQSLLSGQTLAQTKQRVIDTVPTSWRNSWKLWPAVTAFSFTFVAPQYRSVFAGVIAIGWQTYLSWLNMQAQKEEDEKARVSAAAAPVTAPSTALPAA